MAPNLGVKWALLGGSLSNSGVKQGPYQLCSSNSNRSAFHEANIGPGGGGKIVGREPMGVFPGESFWRRTPEEHSPCTGASDLLNAHSRPPLSNPHGAPYGERAGQDVCLEQPRSDARPNCGKGRGRPGARAPDLTTICGALSGRTHKNEEPRRQAELTRRQGLKVVLKKGRIRRPRSLTTSSCALQGLR